MIKKIINHIFLNAKNTFGWKTTRKIVVFSVDDYGNVRLNSKEARKSMDSAGMKIYSRFDSLDTLETKQDLEQLLDVLNSVTDKNGRSAIFTAFAMPCNIDFEKMASENYEKFHYELLTETYRKLAILQPESYDGAWQMWQKGMKLGFIKPQFHGREHLNLAIFNDKLNKKDLDILTALKNKSYTSISAKKYPNMVYTAAFDFGEVEENEGLKPVIVDGLQCFERVFGFKSNYFTPPVFNIHNSLFSTLKTNHIKFIDLAMIRNEHQGLGKYKRSFNYTGKKTKEGLTMIIRNAVFEPTEIRGLDWVNFTIKQIETSFKWNKPAVISSHRVNFCGHIDPANREKGLTSLKNLLDAIVTKWPDVEFMSADELGDLILTEN
jgi:hypothetical protein